MCGGYRARPHIWCSYGADPTQKYTSNDIYYLKNGFHSVWRSKLRCRLCVRLMWVRRSLPAAGRPWSRGECAVVDTPWGKSCEDTWKNKFTAQFSVELVTISSNEAPTRCPTLHFLLERQKLAVTPPIHSLNRRQKQSNNHVIPDVSSHYQSFLAPRHKILPC